MKFLHLVSSESNGGLEGDQERSAEWAACYGGNTKGGQLN